MSEDKKTELLRVRSQLDQAAGEYQALLNSPANPEKETKFWEKLDRLCKQLRQLEHGS